MVSQRVYRGFGLLLFLLLSGQSFAQQAGGIRGIVYDKDFDVPLAEAQVQIAEAGVSAVASSEGNYVFEQVAPGSYTLVFYKDGYTRQIKSDVIVSPGQMTEVDMYMPGDFTEMDEFIVQDIQFGAGTEEALLQLRMDSPALIDSISANLMSQAGVSDAASALPLVSGTTVQDGKYAVVRGLPDRYVNSQMNGVRLPTADTDKRAVQLDQFPAAVIESIQVTKTFTPDQQGDASGGAVNVMLKGIPDEAVLKFSTNTSYNSQTTGEDDFLSYKDGGLNFWGDDERDIPYDDLGSNWDGAVGVSRDDAPYDYKWSIDAGNKYEFENGIKIGGFGNFFYERDSQYIGDKVENKYWVTDPGAPMTPQTSQGTPEQGDFKTSLYDVEQGSQEVKWGGLGSIGVETENHKLSLLYMRTHVAEDAATLAEDTRGKSFFFPGYDPNDPTAPGNRERSAAPFLRTETLEYTERQTETWQLSGKHTLPDPAFEFYNIFKTKAPEFDWTLSKNSASLYQPDKRQFGSQFWAESYNPGYPPYLPPFTNPAVHLPFKPAANFTIGNLQRIWKDISEESDQYSYNIKLPFEQWSESEGYFKFGIFNDQVTREYTQESFSNFNDNSAFYEGLWEDFWSSQFPFENHPITAAEIDVNYTGKQDISAWYYMADIPLTSFFNIIGGARHENTELSIINDPERDVTWFPPGSPGQVVLNPGDADVSFEQNDVLPSIGFVAKPHDKVTLRGTYSETVARQTFKELAPIQQQEYLGGDVFIGNPFLQMSALENYDLRLDYTPYESGLISAAYFFKDVTDPIEYVQRIADFDYTTAVNYPKGELSGVELEFRQELSPVWKRLAGLSLGANATLIESEVTLPEDESAGFDQPNIQAPMKTRDMTNAPEHLYNIFMTYDLEKMGLTGSEVALFYTVRGDALIAGAGQAKGNFVPDVYETEYGTLNASFSQKIGDAWKIKLQAKNLLDPDIDTVYRSDYIAKDVTKSSYKKGREFSISLSYEF